MQEWSNAELTIAGLALVYALREFVVPIIKGSFAKNASAEQEKFRELKLKVDDHEKQLNQVRADNSQLTGQFGEIKGRLEALDNRIAKQGEVHDAKLSEALANLATEFNRKLTSTLNTELERTVREALREELRTKKR